eukprot:2551531-Rhodomonas_salina.1
MGRRPKGKDSASVAASAAAFQSKLSTFFTKEVAPLFEKPQGRLKAAEGGEGGQAEGGSSAAAADSGAAASSDSEPIIIEDGDGAGAAGGGMTKDDDATESEDEKMPESSTDTDGQTELPLSTELTAKLS